MKKKYLVIGSYVRGKNDREEHFIDAYKLCRLYGLNPHAPNVRLADIRRRETLLGYDGSWIRLFPREDGDYSLEVKEER